MVYSPYHTDADMIEVKFNDPFLTGTVQDVRREKFYEFNYSVSDGLVTVGSASISVVRNGKRFWRAAGLPIHLFRPIALAYQRKLKIGIEPVVGDYIDEGERIIQINADGSYLFSYDDEDERTVWLGGGAIEWHKKTA